MSQTVQMNGGFSFSSFFTVPGDPSRSIASHRGLSSLWTLRSSTAPGMSREFLLQEPLETLRNPLISIDFTLQDLFLVGGWEQWPQGVETTSQVLFLVFFLLAKVVMKPAATCWVDPPNGDPVLAFSLRQQMQHQNTFENRETNFKPTIESQVPENCRFETQRVMNPLRGWVIQVSRRRASAPFGATLGTGGSGRKFWPWWRSTTAPRPLPWALSQPRLGCFFWINLDLLWKGQMLVGTGENEKAPGDMTIDKPWRIYIYIYIYVPLFIIICDFICVVVIW